MEKLIGYDSSEQSRSKKISQASNLGLDKHSKQAYIVQHGRESERTPWCKRGISSLYW